MTPTINTRADLAALRDTDAYPEALRMLRGSLVATINTAEYPEGYFDAGYDGPPVEPVWTEIESLEALTLLGLSRSEFVAEWNTTFPAEAME